MTIEGGRLGADVLRILRELPAVTVVDEKPRGPSKADAILHFAGTHAPVAVEFKHRANAATARQLVEHAHAHEDLTILLIADEATAEAREILERNGVGVIDGRGNAHLELPGLLVHLEGRPRAPRSVAHPTRLSGKAGLAAQALLLAPNREWRVQDLANEANVAKALAHRVLVRLESEGVVAATGTGPRRVRRVTNATALLDLWAEESVDRPRRTKGYSLARTPQELALNLGAKLGDHGIDYAITGASAASLVAPFVTAVPVVQIWVPDRVAPDELLEAADAEPATDGENVVLLQAKNDAQLAFREKVGELWLANRFRLYADLRRDPRRGPEQAEHLRRELIGF